MKQTWFFNHFGLPLARFAGAVFLMVFGPMRVRHYRRVPKTGGLLILANHLADVDPVLVQVGCRRTVYFMAKSELFTMPVVGKALKMFHAFPVNRGEPDRQAIKHAVELLKSGETVCVFPEGQLSEDGHLQELKPGVALIVRMAGVPVICCAVKNTNRVMPYGKVLPRPAFAWVTATWGEPKQFEKSPDTEAMIAWVEGELLALGAP